ncbi:M20/M25/M40 family metallo-hydrolase [Sphingomonas lutea]|uniref:M20/M25/M40 family metallo-hydrolase n=1 Tax=Sphingomonas lutea TaxID=1045317 RepID=A0A7G9SIV4_9SPHN|nr:M20/M25/M40 family metallo-hydrolase [Sphingomonas lutea]QNN67779.1 M20/M25/M40 family metallo-hydrolase [Sphingomonas lutea]
MRPFLLSALLLGLTVPAFAQSAPDAAVRQIVAGVPFKRAAAALDAGHDQWIADTITLTEIPAPPFKEAARAKAFADMLRARGLSDVEIDAEGNVLGLRKGTAAGPVVVVSAHLDTVFPEGTNVKVRREGEKLHAPGVGDDSAGLATILSLIDAMKAGDIRTRRDILFVGTVGEEGPGDLRGVRHLFTKGKYQGRIGAFFSIDGGGLQSVTTAGTGSKRYRITYKGPGGHSYGAFGLVNPMGALAGTVTGLYQIKVPAKPKTTYSASVVGGGTSVNSIPQEVWLEVDMRSESAAELAKVERQFLDVVARSVAAENAARDTREGKVTADTKKIGDRPAGQTPATSDIVRFTEAAYRTEGINVRQSASSTDSNLPMSLGIPALTLPRGSSGNRAHAPDEWIGIEKADNVKVRRIVLAAILATAGAN